MKKRMGSGKVLKLTFLSAFIGFSGSALASGFQLFEDSAVNMGDFASGGAALAQDASTSFENPAGLVRIKTPQIVVSGVAAFAKVDFGGIVTTKNATTNAVVNSFAGDASGGKTGFIPAFHYAVPLNDRVAFGFSVTTPYGLGTEYEDNSVVRYSATRTEIATLDVSPSLGVKINDQLSVGAGVVAQYARANLDSYSYHPLLATTLNSLNSGSDWGYGWHAGALYQFNPCTRVGLSYRSAVDHTLTGDSKAIVVATGATASSSNDLSTDITLPATTTLSGYHQLNDRWALLGSVRYTQWSSIDNIVLRGVAGGVTVTMPENFRDTWRLGVGANYKVNEQWLLRAGVGYDQTPTNDVDRTVRLPDGDRLGVSVGTHYQYCKNLGVDVGYTHQFVQSVALNNTSTVGGQTVVTAGTSSNAVDLVGVQFTWDFV